MFVSRGLVGPKLYHNLNTATGKQVNIPVPCVNNTDASGYTQRNRRSVQSYKLLEYRNGEN